MKGQLKASTPAEYIGQLTEPRLTEIAALDALIRETAPQLEPFIHAGMLAYGPWHYKYASGREGDWFRVGIASNKNYISLYVSLNISLDNAVGDETGYVAERYKDALPKANIGKGCIRFKRLSDVDQTVLRLLFAEVATLAAKA